METVPSLVALALERISALPDDHARVAALRVLLASLHETHNPPEDGRAMLERALVAGTALVDPRCRVAAFEDACRAIGTSDLPLGDRRDLLTRALDLALAREDVERIVASATALRTRLDLRYAERADEVLEDIVAAAKALSDEGMRAGALLEIVRPLARSGATEDALACVNALPAGGERALGLMRVALACRVQGEDDEAAALFGDAVEHASKAPTAPSAEGTSIASHARTTALREILAYAVEIGGDVGSEAALVPALAVVPMLASPEAQRDALLGAISALPTTTIEPGRIAALAQTLEVAIDRVDVPDERLRLHGRLAVALAALGETEACLRILASVASLVGRLERAWIREPLLSLPVALPVLEILDLLAGGDFTPYELERFGAGAVDLLDTLRDVSGVGALLGEMTRAFANPVLPYTTRVALLDRVLAAAHRIEADDARIQLVAHVANGLSMAGATERGDALFAGLVAGVGARASRDVRLSRAVTLVRLARSPEARAEIAAAAASSDWTLQDVEVVATAMARCGFMADLMAELGRISGDYRDPVLVRVADRLVEASYLDPFLREVGLTSMLEGTEEPVRSLIAALLDQLRLCEGLGEAREIVTKAAARSEALHDRATAAILDQKILDALIERIRLADRTLGHGGVA